MVLPQFCHAFLLSAKELRPPCSSLVPKDPTRQLLELSSPPEQGMCLVLMLSSDGFVD